MKDILSLIKGQGPDAVTKDVGHPSNPNCNILYRVIEKITFPITKQRLLRKNKVQANSN